MRKKQTVRMCWEIALGILVWLQCGLNLSAAKTDTIIEKALVKVVYERTIVTDTLDRLGDFKRYPMTLKIGNNISSFFNEECVKEDSIIRKNEAYRHALWDDREASRRHYRLPRDAVFKNFSEGVLITYDRFDLMGWKIPESLEKPAWEVYPDSTALMLNYECIMATCSFRGRNWKVYFTPEIPISDGPWKLWGLPGLILLAEDLRQDYRYEAVSVETEGIGYVKDFHPGSGHTKSERIKALQRKYKALHEDLGYKIFMSGKYGLDPSKAKKRAHKPHSNYDFEETDYPHEEK